MSNEVQKVVDLLIKTRDEVLSKYAAKGKSPHADHLLEDTVLACFSQLTKIFSPITKDKFNQVNKERAYFESQLRTLTEQHEHMKPEFNIESIAHRESYDTLLERYFKVVDHITKEDEDEY